MTRSDKATVESRSPFETTADIEFSRWDKISTAYHEHVVTPFLIIWSDWRARVGALIIIGYILMGTVGVLIVEPTHSNDGPVLVQAFQTWEYPLGTDRLGHDLLALMVHATPKMWKMILGGAVFSTVVATVVGTVSGYSDGLVDHVLTVIMDIAINMPGLPLVIVFAAILEPRDPFVIGIILSIAAWAGLARSIRSQVLTLREESYVEASFAMDMSMWYIVRRDILPNIMPYITINFTSAARGVIYGSVGLYFLGILPYSRQNWGVVLDAAYSGGAMQSMARVHWLLVPMVTIVGLSVGLVLFAQGLDRLFNPRMRAKYETNGETPSDRQSVRVDEETADSSSE